MRANELKLVKSLVGFQQGFLFIVLSEQMFLVLRRKVTFTPSGNRVGLEGVCIWIQKKRRKKGGWLLKGADGFYPLGNLLCGLDLEKNSICFSEIKLYTTSKNEEFIAFCLYSFCLF